jgi:hypothetical protein
MNNHVGSCWYVSSTCIFETDISTSWVKIFSAELKEIRLDLHFLPLHWFCLILHPSWVLTASNRSLLGEHTDTFILFVLNHCVLKAAQSKLRCSHSLIDCKLLDVYDFNSCWSLQVMPRMSCGSGSTLAAK